MASTPFDHGSDSKRVAFRHKTARSQLGVSFKPCDFSVICGRGEASYNHEGNRCFRILAIVFAESYSQAGSKGIKSALVLHIVAMIRRAGGHFCKYEKGAWFEVGDRCAREKVSAALRDVLHAQYPSSSKTKTARRKTRKTDNRKDHQDQQLDRKLVDDTLQSDDSSTTSACWGSTNDSLAGFDNCLEDDFFDINVF